MKLSFPKDGSLADFQDFIDQVYSLPDNRLYSIQDLIVQQQRFTMRALKGIRKNNLEKVKLNLLISFSWLMAIANRLHLDTESDLWHRFPSICSYCGKKPCACKTIKPTKRAKLKIKNSARPLTLADFQEMFNDIYPAHSRSLTEAGIHLAEEMGEVSEAIHNYLGQHLLKQFDEIKIEIADFISCVFGVANSAGIDLAKNLSLMYPHNCHACHQAPCICSFSAVVKIKT